MENNSFGFRLRNARKSANMTQKELALAIGAKHNSVSNWENDQNMPDPDTIVRICEVLNVSASYMLPSKTESKLDKKTGVLDLQIFASGDTISEEAQAFAAKYDSLSEYGKEMIRCILQNDKQYKIMKRVQMLGTAYVDGRIETKLAAMKEVREIESDLKEAVQVFE